MENATLNTLILDERGELNICPICSNAVHNSNFKAHLDCVVNHYIEHLTK